MSTRIPPRVAALEAALAALCARVEQLERQAGGRREDDRALMRAIVGSVGAAVFSAGELVAHAALDPELRAVLARYPTAKHVGKRLRAIAGQPIAGFVLRRITRDSQGTIWGLQVAPDLHAGAGPREDSDV